MNAVVPQMEGDTDLTENLPAGDINGLLLSCVQTEPHTVQMLVSLLVPGSWKTKPKTTHIHICYTYSGEGDVMCHTFKSKIFFPCQDNLPRESMMILHDLTKHVLLYKNFHGQIVSNVYKWHSRSRPVPGGDLCVRETVLCVSRCCCTWYTCLFCSLPPTAWQLG